MTDYLYVLNEGSSIPTSFTTPANSNTNTSVNPRLLSVLNDADHTQSNRSYVEIYKSDKTTLEVSTSTQFFPTTIGTYTQNIYETPGYRVTLDIETSSPLIDLDSDDFFVLLNSENMYEHHFAKITEFTQYEGTQYSFDFTPKYGEIVPRGTNVIIIQGSAKGLSSYEDLVAVGYALHSADDTEERNDRYCEVSRPTFYFYGDEDRLEPNTKYTAIKQVIPSGSVASSVFKTAPVSSDMVLDKSFYTQSGTIVDSRKTADEAQSLSTWNSFLTNYDGRAGTDPISTYITFIDSPMRNQILSAPTSINVESTMTNRGNYFEATYMDPERAMDKKVKDNESLTIKYHIGSDDIGEAPSFLLPGIMNNGSSADEIEVTGLSEGQDLRDLLGTSTYEPIMIGSYYYLISSIGIPVDGNQTITISNKRALGDATFGGSTTVETLDDSRAYRKVWSGKVENLGVTHHIDTSYDGVTSSRNGTDVTEAEADIYGLEYYVGGDNYGVNMKIARGDNLNGFTTLQTIPSGVFNTNTNLMECIRTGFSYLKTIMSVNVELKQTDTTGGAFTFKIGGRDSIAKLLDVPINRNYVYSQEYIYSSNTPIGTMEELSLNIDDISGYILSLNGSYSSLSFGDNLYLKDTNGNYYLLGTVRDKTSTLIYLIKPSYIQDLDNIDGVTFETFSVGGVDNPRVYRVKQGLLMGKSLSNYYNINGATTLEGASNKGYTFNSGRDIGFTADNSLLVDIESTNTLNGFPIETVIGGYSRTGEENKYRDNPYGITDLDTALHTISSLVEYDIIPNAPKLNSEQTTYTIGYISPLVVGRVYGSNRNEDWLDSQSTTSGRYQDSFYLVNGQGLPDGGFLHLLDNNMDTTYYTASDYVKTPRTFNHEFSDDPLDASTAKNQYGIMYGTPIWRYTNKHKGNFKQTLTLLGSLEPKIVTNADRGALRNDYYEKETNFSFALSGYRTSGGTVFANDTYNATLSAAYYKSTPIERSGTKPAIGSRFFDITRYPGFYYDVDNNLSTRIELTEVSEAHAYFEAWDSYAGPLHLFLPGDIYPESKSQWNNLDYPQVSRNITDYSIILKADNETTDTLNHFSTTYPTDWEGVGNIGNKKDSDYFSRNIISSSGNRNRMNVVRMTEVVFDLMFNEVDYENYKFENVGTENTDYIYDSTLMRRHWFATNECTFTSYSGSNVTVSNDTWFDAAANQYLYVKQTVNGHSILQYLGEVTGNPSSGVITLNTTSAEHSLADLVASEALYVIDKDNATTLPIITTTTKNKTPISSLSSEDNRNATAAYTFAGTPTAGVYIDASSEAAGVRGYMRRPLFASSGALETDMNLYHRFSYDSQSGVGLYDYSDVDPVLMCVERLPGEGNSDIQDFKLGVMKGASDRESSTIISSVDVKNVSHGSAFSSSEVLTTTFDNALLGDDSESTDLEKTRKVEMLFRPRFDNFTIYTSSQDDTLTSDERILAIDVEEDYTSPSGTNSWLHYANNLAGYYIGNSSTGKLHYIKSHEISKSDTVGLTFKHFLKIDNATTFTLTNPENLHLLKIAQNCFYKFTPNKIVLNNLSSIYTKVPGEDRMHEANVYSARKAEAGEPVKEGSGIVSGFYIVQIDGNDGDYLITRNTSDLTFENSFALNSLENVYITDGINSYQTGMMLEGTTYARMLSLGEMKPMKGTPSVGSVFTVTVDSPPDFTPTKASIATSLNINYHTEDIVDDILTNLGVDYDQSEISNTYYVSQNFTGQNAFAASNSVLRFNNKKLLVLGDSVKIVSNEETKNYRNVEFSEDSNDYQVTMLKKDKSLFDSFNVVEVIGSGVRSRIKNYTNIKKLGREKVKEVFDYTITTQKDADLIARNLLRLYSEEGFAIEINVGSDIPFIKPGNIVAVYYPSEGIFRSEFIVIEIERSFGMPTKLKLGQYNRELSNTMSLLLSETKNLQGITKQKVYSSVRIPSIDYQTVRIKFVKADITNLTDDTTSTIGFGYTIGFDSEVGP